MLSSVLCVIAIILKLFFLHLQLQHESQALKQPQIVSIWKVSFNFSENFVFQSNLITVSVLLYPVFFFPSLEPGTSTTGNKAFNIHLYYIISCCKVWLYFILISSLNNCCQVIFQNVIFQHRRWQLQIKVCLSKI